MFGHPVIFPNPEASVISALKQQITSMKVEYPVLNDVTVSTKLKPIGTTPYPKAQVIVQHDGGIDIYSGTVREDSFTIKVCAKDYGVVADITRVLNPLMRKVNSHGIIKIEVDQAGFREPADGEWEIIRMSVVAMLRGTDLT